MCSSDLSGVALCRHHSLTHQLLVLWGLPCFTSILLIISMIMDRKKDGKKNLGGFLSGIAVPDMYAGILALCAIGLVLIPEIVYVRDIYEEGNARANTMFKLTYQAYIMFGIVMGYGVIRLIRISKKVVYKISGALALICLAATAGYMGNACGSWFGDGIQNLNYRGLYALGHLDVDFVADANAIYWLKENVKGSPVVLEANGNSYTGYNRVSASTGLPTPLGWYVHEWLWRSDTENLKLISEDIQTIYTSEDLDVVKGLLIDYNVSYIFVGAFEKEKFSRDMDEAAAAGAKVKRYLDCDLLILDDLGTEMNTAFTQSALYTIINQRLIGGKQTIISTNLDEAAMTAQYSPQIVSRLLGEYRWLHFLGSDIRQMKN